MRLLLFLFTITIFILQANPGICQQAKILHTCYAGSKPGEVSCDIRFAEPWLAPGAPEKLEIVWPDGMRDVANFVAYNPNEQTTAWLLLFDQSKSLKDNTIKAIREDFGEIIATLRSKERIGISNFAERFQLIAPIGAPREDLVEVLQTLQPVGDQTLLYNSALDALEIIGAYEADRRALVIVTDGKSEDSPDLTFQDVIDRAKELGVVIYGIGYSEKPTDDIYLNDLKQMADSTQGPSQLAKLQQPNERPLSPRLKQYFFDFMQNGGIATFTNRSPEKDVTVKLVATLENGRQLATTVDLSPAFLERPKGPFGIPKKYETLVLAAIGCFVALALLGIVLLLLRKKEQPISVEQDIETPIIADLPENADQVSEVRTDAQEFEPEVSSQTHDEPTQYLSNQQRSGTASAQIYGWLERLDQSSQRIAIDSTAISIGRHQDNNIQFSESTVHRRHAALHMTANQEFTITNLSGTDGNGIIVNGDRVEKTALNNGDLIEMGDVRIRFLKA